MKNLLEEKEISIIKLAAEGLNNKQIAENLGFKDEKIKEILSEIYRKLGVKNRIQASIIYLNEN